MTTHNKSYHPVDIHVGEQIRKRRLKLYLSQQDLGDAVDLTFQQIQKYERGKNRVSASMLYKLSKALRADINYFFMGLEKETYKFLKTPSKAALAEKETGYDKDNIDLDTEELISAFVKIKHLALRHQIISLTKSLSEFQNNY